MVPQMWHGVLWHFGDKYNYSPLYRNQKGPYENYLNSIQIIPYSWVTASHPKVRAQLFHDSYNANDGLAYVAGFAIY